MSEARDDTESAAESVFGNLPGSRPGTRSPRRDGRKQAESRSTTKRTSPPKGTSPPKRAPAGPARPADAPAGEPVGGTQRQPPDEPQAGPDAPSPGGQIGGVEDLAWAGVAVAAEAATLGVRLAGRAFEAMRDAVERR